MSSKAMSTSSSKAGEDTTANSVAQANEHTSPPAKKKSTTATKQPKAKKGGAQNVKAKNIQHMFLHQQHDQMQQMNRILTTHHKVQIFAELCATRGITRPEVLRELEALSDEAAAAITTDDVLLMIVAKREMLKSAHQANEAQLKAQEDAILDQVILLSEGEREHIQVRVKFTVHYSNPVIRSKHDNYPYPLS